MYHGERLFTALVVLLALTAGWVPASAAVTLEYWIWDQNQLPATKEAIARFEAQHDIKVEVLLVPFPEFFTKVTLGLVSGTGPDVFWMTMYDFGSFHSNNMLLNLQPYIDADPEAAAYMDAIWPVLRDFYAPGGQAYGFPRDFDTIALVYNRNARSGACRTCYNRKHLDVGRFSHLFAEAHAAHGRRGNSLGLLDGRMGPTVLVPPLERERRVGVQCRRNPGDP